MKVKSNAGRDDIIAEALKEHASFDHSFDSISPVGVRTFTGYSTIMWSEMAYFLATQQSCDLKWLTFIGYSTIM